MGVFYERGDPGGVGVSYERGSLVAGPSPRAVYVIRTLSYRATQVRGFCEGAKPRGLDTRVPRS